MIKYSVCTLDVWGNENDGWEINQTYETGKTVEFDNEDFTDEDIVNALKEDGFVKDTIKLTDVEIEGDDIYLIGINDATNNRPVYELRLIED